MRRFQNILVPYFGHVGDEATLTRGVRLARRNRARLTLLSVPDRSASFELLLEHRSRLKRTVLSIQQEGIDATAKILEDDPPFVGITREVLRGKHDLVLMTVEKRANFRTLLFGATSMHLMRKCPCPVWVTKPEQSGGYNRILAAVDLGISDPEGHWINQLIVDLSVSLARQERCPLLVAHAWDLSGEELLASRSEISDNMMAELVRRNVAPLEARFEQMLAGHDLQGVQCRTRLVRGPAGVAITTLARRESVDLIVMGTACRTGVAGFLNGNTSEAVLHQVGCSVLSVKPRSFVTQVALPDR